MRRSVLALITVLSLGACFGASQTDAGADTDTETGDGDPGDGDPGDGDPTGDGDGDPGGDVCGDGVVTGEEECDNGPDNADSAACTSTCTIATCGDGLVFVGGEDCDDAGESPSCDDDCTAVECGDANVNAAAGEQCEGEGLVNNGRCTGCALSCEANYQDCNQSDDDGCEIYVCGGGTCDNPQLQPGSVQLDYTGAFQMWQVPACVDTLTIEAFGASGGAGTNPAYPGGLGARMRGEFAVDEGETLVIVVGGEGLDATNTADQAGGSGGGGTFVVRPPMNMPMPMIVAGGGGGASVVDMQGEISAPGGHGQTTQVGQDGDGGGAGLGGSDGNGGGTCEWPGWHGGTGGGGFSGNGLGPSMGDQAQYGSPNTAGRAFVNGGQGGVGGSGGGRDGGFGGGGAAGFSGGGGGGYSGGGAGCLGGEINSGGGGGSFNLGSNQDNDIGNNLGDGKVVLSW